MYRLNIVYRRSINRPQHRLPRRITASTAGTAVVLSPEADPPRKQLEGTRYVAIETK